MDVHGVPTDNISDQYRKHVQLINAMRAQLILLIITTSAASDKMIQSSGDLKRRVAREGLFRTGHVQVKDMFVQEE